MKKLNYLIAMFLVSLPVMAMAGHMGGGACGHGGCGGKGVMGFACLLTLALGYWVIKTASGDKGVSKRVGQLAGWIIFLVSLAGLVCTAARCIKQCKEGSGMCPMSSSQNVDEDEEDDEDEEIMPVKRMKK